MSEKEAGEENSQWVTLPVRVYRGQLVPCGAVPALREGAIGEVRLPADALQPRDLIESLSTLPSLPVGAEVRFPVRADRVPSELLPHTLPCPDERGFTGRKKPPCLWVPVTLTHPLHGWTSRDGRTTLRGGACHIPALNCTARSLNHAYTLLSETFEPHRLGHTGSAWRKAHIWDGTRWKCLDEMRTPRVTAPREATRLVRAPSRRGNTGAGGATGQLF